MFSSSRRPIEIPDEEGVRLMNQGLVRRDVLTWRLPSTGIVLASDAEQEGNDWYFSPSTVASAAKMYNEIELKLNIERSSIRNSRFIAISLNAMASCAAEVVSQSA